MGVVFIGFELGPGVGEARDKADDFCFFAGDGPGPELMIDRGSGDDAGGAFLTGVGVVIGGASFGLLFGGLTCAGVGVACDACDA